MYVTELAHTCGSVARGLVQAYVKGCECICIVHDRPSPEVKEAKLGTPGNGMPAMRAPSEPESYHMVPRIF